MEEKKSNKGLIIVIIVVVSLIFILPLIISMLGIILIPKMLSSMNEKIGVANYNVGELKIYIPSHWERQDEFVISKSGKCRIIGGETRYDQDRIERAYLKDELEHEQIQINGIDVSYGFKNTEEEKIYSYFIEHNNQKYTIIFINKVDSDEECNTYIDKLEQSIEIGEE